MKITYKGDYALKALLELAVQYRGDGSVIKINWLAKKLDIPLKYLEALLVTLKRGGFLKSKRGKEGGYYLAMAPSNIKLGAVIRYLEGPIEPIACVNEGYKECKDIHTCALRGVWCRTSAAVANIVDNITMEDLSKEVMTIKNTPTYNI